MQGSNADPVVSKYIASGLNREAVPLAVANYGDNPTKVITISWFTPTPPSCPPPFLFRIPNHIISVHGCGNGLDSSSTFFLCHEQRASLTEDIHSRSTSNTTFKMLCYNFFCSNFSFRLYFLEFIFYLFRIYK